MKKKTNNKKKQNKNKKTKQKTKNKKNKKQNKRVPQCTNEAQHSTCDVFLRRFVFMFIYYL